MDKKQMSDAELEKLKTKYPVQQIISETKRPVSDDVIEDGVNEINPDTNSMESRG